MRYIPHTSEDTRQMLDKIGVDSIDDLFSSIPDHLKLKEPLPMPEPLYEMELLKEMQALAGKNIDPKNYLSFLGAGYYHHFCPSAVDHLLSRSEFYSAYTPYQPEVSQGTLQAMFEFQSLICALTGMEISNASMYDGASATAEALLMASRIKKKGKRILVASSLHPEYRQTCQTYFNFQDIPLQPVDYHTQKGCLDLEHLEARLQEDGEVIALVVSYPNFFGCLEPLAEIKEICVKHNILLVVTVPEPLSLGALTPPGDFGADIVIGEGQSLGNKLNFGGPGLGFFATKDMYKRQVPGRLVSRTRDCENNSCYTLTLSTREQHIRREKATSNICTNQNLCALTSTIYLSMLGKSGFKNLSYINIDITEQAIKILGQKGIKPRFTSPQFNEVAVEINGDLESTYPSLLARNIIPGLPLTNYYPELKNCLLLNFTEIHSSKDLELLAEELSNPS